MNYQLMGSNTWQHHHSYEELNKQTTPLYLSFKANEQGQFSLLNLSDNPKEKLKESLKAKTAEKTINSITQQVDLTDRATQNNTAPWPIIQDQLNEPNGLVFLTEPMDKDHQLAGAITGHFSIAINKHDVDIGYNFYEITKDGKVFHLNNYRSCASFAKDMEKRQLLTPNQKTIIPIVNGRMTAKLIKKGSRLVIVLNVNKNVDAQVNMGSGKAVNDESIADAGVPLELTWFNDSQINIPLSVWAEIN